MPACRLSACLAANMGAALALATELDLPVPARTQPWLVGMDAPAPADGGFNDQLSAEFEKHAERLRERARARRDAVKLRAPVLDREDREHASEADSLGKWQPQDEMQGDVNLRTLRTLLKMVDERGFERCARALLVPVHPRAHPVLPRAPPCSPVLSTLLLGRSAHQLRFHSSFERSTARIIFKQDWGTQRPAIMKKNGWATCSSEVMIR